MAQPANNSNIDTVLKNLKKSKYTQLFPDFSQERTQKTTSLVLTLIALSFFGLFAINPTLSTIAKLKKELSDNEFIDKSLVQKIADLSVLEQKYFLLKEDIPIVLAAVPKGPSAPLLMAQLQSLASNSNIEIVNLQTFQVETAPSLNPPLNQPLKTLETKKNYKAFSFEISAKGSYESISTFISSLINMQRVISVDTLAISKSSDKNLRLDLKGTAYFKQ